MLHTLWEQIYPRISRPIGMPPSRSHGSDCAADTSRGHSEKGHIPVACCRRSGLPGAPVGLLGHRPQPTSAIDRGTTVGYAVKRLTHPTRCASKPLYLNTAAACPWIISLRTSASAVQRYSCCPACAGMTVPDGIPPTSSSPRRRGPRMSPDATTALRKRRAWEPVGWLGRRP